MLRTQLFANIRICQPSAFVSTASQKWDLFSAVCVERKPRIVPDMDEIQRQFHDQLMHIEYENSYKSPHEIRHEKDVNQLGLLKSGDLDADLGIKETAQDFVDMSIDELNKFQYAPITTAADNKQELSSVNRKLRQSLVLLTKQKLGNKDHFLLPQSLHKDGETLRQTAERTLKDLLGDEVKAQIYGNAPIGFYKYKYSKAAQNTVIGAKVFFYFARYQCGNVDKNMEHKWLDRQELADELPQKYYKCVNMFLVDE